MTDEGPSFDNEAACLAGRPRHRSDLNIWEKPICVVCKKPCIDHVNVAFPTNTKSEDVLWGSIVEENYLMLNKIYGTDPRHAVMARAVATKIVFGIPYSWKVI